MIADVPSLPREIFLNVALSKGFSYLVDRAATVRRLCLLQHLERTSARRRLRGINRRDIGSRLVDTKRRIAVVAADFVWIFEQFGS